ncbi:MAG TPA: 4Fe-4S binding protein [bacterium]|nr:4Fe-4S binding protein [bacterium]
MSSTRPDVFASLPRLDRHRPKGEVRRSRVARWRALALIAVHVLIAVHIWHWLATGETVTPVEPSEAMQTIEAGRINAGFLLFTLMVASTLLVGRFFCGWACHLVALQDLSAWLLRRVGWRPRPVRSRLLVAAPWVVGGYMFVWPVVRAWLGWVEPLPKVDAWQWQLTTSDLWATFPGPIMTTMTVLVVGGLIVWWLGAKGFCTYGCPYGAFFAMADRLAPVRIVVDRSKCEHCGHCTEACSSNVRVHEEVARHGKVVDPGCMKCLDCVSVCPKDALRVGLAAPKPLVLSQQRIAARGDFRWWEELLLAAVALVATQWVWRGAWFGEAVPFLLSVGLGALTAVSTLLLLRLLLRAEVTFQHTLLRRAGRCTRAGRWAFVGLAAWLLFAGHTFVAQRNRAAVLAEVDALSASATAADLERALGDADRAHGWDLVDDPRVGEVRGLLLRRLQRHAEAERALLASYRAAGHLSFGQANLVLAMYSMDPARRRYNLARELVDAVLARAPEHPVALQLRSQLDRLAK